MRVAVIGGTGHTGTFLVPRLVAAGHEVIAVSRGRHALYHEDPAWCSVERIAIDREQAEREGNFGARIRELQAEAVIDLICFTPRSAAQLVDALDGAVQHFLHCGSIWVHGYSAIVPTDETAPRHPVGEYAINKAAIEQALLQRAANGFPATILHPGHIVGPGWVPLNPQGHFNPAVFATLANGLPLSLPNLGMETLHHVHADDVALAFVQALHHREQAIGQSFHAVSGAALTLRGYAEGIAEWFSRPADLRFEPLRAWLDTLPPEDADAAFEHISRSPICSIDKARRLIGYTPRYSSLQAVQDALRWLISRGELPAVAGA